MKNITGGEHDEGLSQGATSNRGARKSLTALVVLLFIAIGMLVSLSPLKDWITPERVTGYFSAMGWMAPAAFVLGAAVLMAVGIPRLVLCSLGGIVFGFAWGLVWSLVGTLLGSYLAFLIVRWSGRDWALRRWPAMRRFSDTVIGEKGVLSVILIRQIPISGFYNNALLAMTRVGSRDFFLGSLVGYLPGAIPAVMVGAGLIQTSATKVAEYVVIAVAASLLLAWGIKWLSRSPESPARHSAILRLLGQGSEKDA